jgi:hypothetical protein
MSIINKCNGGFCSMLRDCSACAGRADENWNGLCAYQDGNAVASEQVEADEVKVQCGDCTCTMGAFQYANWNGLCAYQQ